MNGDTLMNRIFGGVIGIVNLPWSRLDILVYHGSAIGCKLSISWRAQG
jgi:hypothetical protein